jgi:hypothetical protein
LLIEIAFIEYAVLLLGDRTFGFALVLTVMLVCSGLGAMMVERVTKPATTLRWIALIVVGSCLLAIGLAHAGILAILDWPWALRVAMLVLVLGPISIALGLPFPLGLDRFQQEGPALLPWAWALNGAFSVVATPLANLVGHGMGLSALLLFGSICYLATILVWPRK